MLKLLFELIEAIINVLMYKLEIPFTEKRGSGYEYYRWGLLYEEYDTQHDSHVVGIGKFNIAYYGHGPAYTFFWG